MARIFKEYIESPTTSITVTPKVTSQTTNVKHNKTAITNPIYEEIDTVAGMAAVNVEANIGKMYKFTGTSSGGYYNSGLYIVELDTKPIGGRIFYINPNATGAVYTFYDDSGNVLTDQTVSGLAAAVAYTVTGTGSADKFYVYDNSTHSVSDGVTTYNAISGVVSSIRWGYYGINTKATATAIGSGKTNTSKVLAIEDTSSYNSNTIWKYIKALNDNSFNGCNDWFIGSNTEQDQLRNSGLVDWYNEKFIWSSSEYDINRSRYWYYHASYWSWATKYDKYCCFGLRAF